MILKLIFNICKKMSLEYINCQMGKLMGGFNVGEHIAFIHGICKGERIEFTSEEMQLSIHERVLITIRITSALIQNADKETLENISAYLKKVGEKEVGETEGEKEGGEKEGDVKVSF
jgi:hypothetical protein